MALTIDGIDYGRIAILDDDEGVRDSYAEFIEDLEAEPIIFTELEDLSRTVDDVRLKADAVLTDYRLKTSGYAGFNGDSLAVRCTQAGIPTVLCTSYTDIYRLVNRSDVRWLPSLLFSSQMDPFSIRHGLGMAAKECKGHYSSERRPWRSQVCVADSTNNPDVFYVIISGRSPNELIGVRYDEVPVEISNAVRGGQERFHAQVNVGSNSPDTLYITDWEKK